MAQRYIYLPDELNEKLKLEDNASGLIQSLLINHYNLILSPIEKLEEVKRDIEKKNQEADSLQNKIIQIEKKKQEIIEEGIKEESVKEDSIEVWERRRKLQREAFNNWEIDKDKVETLFNEFFNLLKEKKINNIIEFMQIKEINRKQERKR